MESESKPNYKLFNESLSENVQGTNNDSLNRLLANMASVPFNMENNSESKPNYIPSATISAPPAPVPATTTHSPLNNNDNNKSESNVEESINKPEPEPEPEPEEDLLKANEGQQEQQPVETKSILSRPLRKRPSVAPTTTTAEEPEPQEKIENLEATQEEDEDEDEDEDENEDINYNQNENEEDEINTSDFEGLTDTELLELWDSTLNFNERDKIITELKRRNLFPSKELSKWEYETGAYPDSRDPEFLQKLLAKREFSESLQTTWKPRGDPCEDDGTFEVTPVQRFVSNFMSPRTPYMSALLFHGVGVGKTCAAIQIAEAWLSEFPRNQVLIVAPPTIQQGFYRTIFDITRVKIGEYNEPNTASQCTGDLYMRLSNTLFERDPERIQRLVNKQIKRRYKLLG